MRAHGERAHAALDALRALAAENFGDAPEDGAGPGPPAAGDEPEAQVADEPAAGAAGPPEPGSTLRGVAASTGIAIGPVRHLRAAEPEVAGEPSGSPQHERAQLDAARATARERLRAARSAVVARGGEAEAEIFTAHALLLDDAALILEPALERIDAGRRRRRGRGRPRPRTPPRRSASSTIPTCAPGPSTSRTWPGACSPRSPAPRRRDAPAAGDRDRRRADPGGGRRPGPRRRVGDRHRTRRRHGARRDPGPRARDSRRGRPRPGAAAARGGDAAGPRRDRGHRPGRPGRSERWRPSEARRAADEAAHRAVLARAAEPGALADGRRVEVFANVGSAGGGRSRGRSGRRGGRAAADRVPVPRPRARRRRGRAGRRAARDRGGDSRAGPLVVRTLDAGADKPLPFLRQAPEANPFLGVRGIRLSLARAGPAAHPAAGRAAGGRRVPAQADVPDGRDRAGAARRACAARRGARRARQRRASSRSA